MQTFLLGYLLSVIDTAVARPAKQKGEEKKMRKRGCGDD
jgi:hypothetical protein